MQRNKLICSLLLQFLVILSSGGPAGADNPDITTTKAPSATDQRSTANPYKSTPPPQYGKPDATYLPALERFLYRGANENDSYYYDSSVRPDLYDYLDLYAQYYLLGVAEVNEKQGSVVYHGVLLLSWTDNRLQWDPAMFGNITTTTFEGYKIWSPRFLHNGNWILRQYDSVMRADVDFYGSVDMVMSLHETTPCQFDMTKFPRDTQSCQIHLYYADPLVRLKATGSGDISTTDMVVNGGNRHLAWEVLDVNMTTKQEMAGPSDIDLFIINVQMKRHASFFLRIYVIPVCFLLLLIPVIFLLPPDSTEKLTYGAILLFSMIYVGQSVEALYPPYTDSMPYLIKLTTASGALLFLCILLTSLISSAERIGRKRALPIWVKKYIVGVIGKYLLVNENEDGMTHGTVHIKPASDNDRDFIVQSEQGMDFSEEHNGGVGSLEPSNTGDSTQALNALVNELKQSRLQSRTQDNWTNVFTILNRFLFLLTLLVGIIIILCFA